MFIPSLNVRNWGKGGGRTDWGLSVLTLSSFYCIWKRDSSQFSCGTKAPQMPDCTWLKRCSRQLCILSCLSWDMRTLKGSSSPRCQNKNKTKNKTGGYMTLVVVKTPLPSWSLMCSMTVSRQHCIVSFPTALCTPHTFWFASPFWGGFSLSCGIFLC